MAIKQVDVVIVGGGIIGQTLACALAQQSFSVALVEAQKPYRALSEHYSNKVSAISKSSEQIFKNLGVWHNIERSQPYSNMDVGDQDSFGQICFSADDINIDRLGTIVENQALVNALYSHNLASEFISDYNKANITNIERTAKQVFVSLDNNDIITASLVVGADGIHSFVRQHANFAMTFWDYDHIAIVASVRTSQAHDNTARQTFTPYGPLAFLPLPDPHQCSIVWSQQTQQANNLLALSNTNFEKALCVAFGNQLGACKLSSDIASFPLKMQYARQWADERVVLVGDAAHSIHPLAGQGANLGLLDVAALVESLVTARSQNKDIGALSSLRHYERWRKAESVKVIAVMQGFKELFDGSHPLKKWIRGAGLFAADSIPLLKQFFIQQAIGESSKVPTLAKKPNLK